MESWGSIWKLLLYGSIFLNIVFVLLVFFQTALNEIVRDLWRERRRRAEEEKDRLNELYRHLSSYPGYHFSLMMRLLIAERLQSDAELQEHLGAVRDIGDRIEQMQAFFAANELRFPDEIRHGLRDLRTASNAGGILTNPARIFDLHQQVVDVCNRLKRSVERALCRH